MIVENIRIGVEFKKEKMKTVNVEDIKGGGMLFYRCVILRGLRKEGRIRDKKKA